MSRATVSWTPPSVGFYESFDVFSREQGAREWEFRDSTRSNRIDLDFPDFGTFEVGIAPVTSGVVAAPDDWTTLVFTPEDIGDLTAISTPTNFRAAQEGNLVVAMWDRTTDKRVSYFEIRAGASYEQGMVMAQVPATAGEVRFAPWSTGTTTISIKAISAQGKESSSAIYQITVRGDEYGPIQGTSDEHGGGYTGTKTNTEVSGGNLRQALQPANANAWSGMADTYTWAPFGAAISGGTYVTATMNEGKIVDERIEVDATIALTSVTDVASDWSATIRPEVDGLGAVIPPGTRSIYSYTSATGAYLNGLAVKVEIDTAQDGTPTWEGYRNWVPGATYRFYCARLRFTFTSPWQFAYLKTTALTWRRRRQNRKDEGTLGIAGTGGTDITFTTTFTEAPYLSGNLIHASNSYYVTFSNVTTTGAKARIWDAAGAEQSSGTIHWHAMGL